MREKIMKFLNGVIYIIMIILIITKIMPFILNNQSFGAFDKVIYMIFGIIICVSLFLCQQETIEDDTKTTKDIFSLNVSLVALIVSIIALLKGV